MTKPTQHVRGWLKGLHTQVPDPSLDNIDVSDDAPIVAPGDPFFESLMPLLRLKVMTPLLNDKDKVNNQKLEASEIPNGGGRMWTLKHDLPGNVSTWEKACLVLARYNVIDATNIGHCVPRGSILGSPFYNTSIADVERVVRESEEGALRYLVKSVSDVAEALDGYGGKGSFESLSIGQRYQVFQAIYLQYPLWTLENFRQVEAQFVHFAELFNEGAVDSSERLKWRHYYVAMFAYMCVKISIHGWPGDSLDGRGLAVEAWRKFSQLDAVKVLDLGNHEDLPCVSWRRWGLRRVRAREGR